MWITMLSGQSGIQENSYFHNAEKYAQIPEGA